MEFLTGPQGREQAIIALFTRTFADSGGASEGTLIGELVRRMLADTRPDAIRVFLAADAGVPVGGVLGSRLRFDGDARLVYLLAPVAVATERQRSGIGQRLLRHGLAALREAGVDIAMTYGDPAYYGRVGFRPISVTDAPPPLPLNQPEGWLAQPLSTLALTPLQGPSHCVEALNDPAFW